MNKTIRTDDNDDFDERGILKDGRRLHVPMRLMDSWQGDMVRHFNDARITDAYGDTGDGLHRPGYRLSSTTMRDESCYDEYDAEAQSAWQNNPPTGAGSHGPIGPQEGDLCTVRSGGRDEGAPGHLKMVSGKLVCIPDKRSKDAMPMLDDREQAYLDYENRIQNSWRHGK